jgi:hypothetical protein
MHKCVPLNKLKNLGKISWLTVYFTLEYSTFDPIQIFEMYNEALCYVFKQTNGIMQETGVVCITLPQKCKNYY